MILLIKHAMPLIQPQIPAPHWRLSDAGRDACAALAAALTPYAPEVIVTSEEPKAVETGEHTANYLSVPVMTRAGFHEQDNSGEIYEKEVSDWHAKVWAMFAQRHEVVYGVESAEAAAQRFEAALREVMAHLPGKRLAVVAHGRVITAFVTRYTPEIDAFDLWRSLSLPSFVVLDDDDRLREVVADVAT